MDEAYYSNFDYIYIFFFFTEKYDMNMTSKPGNLIRCWFLQEFPKGGFIMGVFNL